MKTENESKFPIHRSLYAALVVILITIVLSAALFWNIQAMVTQNCWELLENNTHAIKKEIESHMETDIQMLKTQAELLAQCSTDKEIQFYMKMQPHMLSNEYRLLLPDNSIITKNGLVPDSGLSFADETAQGEHISNKTKELDSDRWIVRNFVPVEKNGTTIGMLYGVIYLDTLSERWDFSQYNGKCCVYIMDRKNGDFLLDTWCNVLKNIRDVKGRKAKQGYQYDTMQKDQMQGGSGRCVFASKSAGEDLYYYYEPLEISQWSIALSVQESIAFQYAIAMKQRLLLFIILESIMLISYLLWTLFRVKTNDETHRLQIEKEKELSEFDPLTGVRNRRAFVNISNLYRTAKVPVGFALIDIDNFKQINDSFGHTGGD